MEHVMLALDPSIAAFGWAVVRLGSTPELVAAGVLETKPAPKSKRGSVAEDDARRVRFLRRELTRIFREHRPVIVALEAAAGSKSAKGAKALAQAQTIAACVVDCELDRGQAIYVTALEGGDAVGVQRTQRVAREKSASAAEAKAAATKANRESAKRRKERKSAIAQAVVDRFGVRAWCGALGLPGYELEPSLGEQAVRHERFEGAHDAAAIALAAWERPEVAAVRRMAGSAA